MRKRKLNIVKKITHLTFVSILAIWALPDEFTEKMKSILPIQLIHTSMIDAVATLAPVQLQQTQTEMTPKNTQPPANQPDQKAEPSTSGPKIGKLRIRVIDGRTSQPISGAEVVLIETEKRVVTGQDGLTPWFDAPIIRHPKYRPLVAELHGQLGVIVYKNGYRDSIHIGIRIHDNAPAEETVWMYRIGPGDTRVEPVLYQVPYHRLWLIELADKFRSKTQPGEGPERP